MIKLTIDNKQIEVEKGTTVLQAANRLGIKIPHLCYHKNLPVSGACRLCLVEIEGAKALVSSCSAPAVDGMKVWTDSERVISARKMVLELLLSDHPYDCMTCERNGNCKLQDYAYEYQVKDIRFTGEKRKIGVGDGNPLIIRDYEKCILCGRCVRTCQDIMQINAIDFAGRGFKTTISTVFDIPLDDSTCVMCGNCIAVCPVGALREKPTEGKGRYWEYRKVKTVCTYCGVGCNMELNVKDDRVVKVTSWTDSPVNNGNLCVKGRFGYEFIHHPDRILNPLIRKNGKLVETTYKEAIDYTAKKLTELKEKYGPETLGVFSSSRCTNEENYIMSKFARAVLGTPHVDNCARICHAPSITGLSACFGSGAATNSFDQIEGADVLFVIGSNTTEAHPVVGMNVIKAIRNGAKLIVGDPRKIELAEMSDVWLDLRPGSNIALLNGMMNVIINKGLENRNFINDRTGGYEDLKKVVEKYTPEYVEGITGVNKEKIIAAACLYASAEKSMILYSLGMTEHNTGTQNVMSMGNLALICGQVGRRSTGINPLRGQNNVQGACDMGALPNVHVGYQSVEDPAVRSKFEKAWGIKIPEKKGFQSTKMIELAKEGKLKGLYILGEDPCHTDPNTNLVRESLENLEFLVVQELFPTKTTEIADVVLPAASYAECNGTFTSGERRIQLVRKAIQPLCGRENWQTIIDISNAMGYKMQYNHPSEIMDEIASLAPMFAGVTYERMEEKGLQWPVPGMEHPGTCTMYEEKFNFPSGKAKFNAIEHKDPIEMPDKEYPFTLITGRRREHYNNGSMTRRSSGIMEIWPEETLEISPDDAEKLNISDGEYINLISRRGKVKIKAWVTERARTGRFFTSFHYVDTLTNLVTNSVFDPIAGTPEYKACAVKVEKIINCIAE